MSMKASKVEMARHLYADRTHSIAEICDMVVIGRTTFYRYVRPGETSGE